MQAKSKQNKASRRRRRSLGLCLDCNNKAVKNYVRCEKHRIAERKRALVYARRIRIKLLNKYGWSCARCGYAEDERALQLDHTQGGGTKARKGRGQNAIYRDALKDTTGKYQILCANCNYIKKFEEAGIGRTLIRTADLTGRSDTIHSGESTAVQRKDNSSWTAESEQVVGMSVNGSADSQGQATV